MSRSIEPHRVQWDAEQVKRVWDYYGQNSQYDSTRFSAHSGTAIINWAFSRCRPAKSRNVDIGCGTGDLLIRLLQRPASEVGFVEGLEFSLQSAEAARRRVPPTQRFGGVHLVSDNETVPKGFDFAWMIEVVEHLVDSELENAFALVKLVLRPGGYLVITTPNEENIEAEERICPCCAAVFHPKQHVRSWSASTLNMCLVSHGLEPVAVVQTNWLDHRGPGILKWAKRAYRAIDRADYRPHLGVIARKPV
jgi:SAM-dependent methyltransferase